MNRFASILVLSLFASFAQAAEFYVAQKDAKADDQNAGTEALPFKTIPTAVKAAQPGDTIWVKAGNYEDPVKIDKSASVAKPIVLSAWKDDRVRIGYLPRPLPVEGKWEPIPGSKSWSIKLTADVPEDFILVLNEKAIQTFAQEGPPMEVNKAAYHKADRTLTFNTDGKNPNEMGRFEYGRKPASLSFLIVDGADGWVLRKLEFSYIPEGLRLGGQNTVVEDCFFTHCYTRAIYITSAKANVIRRCNFYRCGCAVDGSGPGDGHIMEDNLAVECSLEPQDDICAIGGIGNSGGPFKLMGSMQSLLFIHNILSDNPGGWWAVGNGSQCSRIIGNAFWDNTVGIYNEEGVSDTMTQGNVFYRNGIGSSWSTRWNIIENLFFEGGIFWNNLEVNPLRDGYMLLRKNAFVHPPQTGYLMSYAIGWGQSAWPEVLSNCLVDRNRIWADKDAVLINEGGAKKCKTLEEVQKEFDWERHGKVMPYDKDRDTVESAAKAMGGSVVTFRVPWGKHGGEARPMLANSQINARWPGAVLSTDPGSVPCYFWRVADGNYEPPPNPWTRSSPHEYWLRSSMDGNPANNCRWYLDAEAKFPKDIEVKTPSLKGRLDMQKLSYTEGNVWLAMEGVGPDQMLPQGMGYWTPLLGAAPGAKITVSLKMRGKDLASSEKGSPAVWVQFTNETGQHRQRVFVVGKDDDGKMRHEELTQGSYDWTDVKQTITAPQGAVRMALFLGLLPCKGQVNFDDVNITTASEVRKR
jgi:hypothetical protein